MQDFPWPIRPSRLATRQTSGRRDVPEGTPITRGVQGLVELLVTVGTDGTAKDISAFKTSRSKELDDAAIASASKFK